MAGISVEWASFNEEKPFGKGTIVGGDNIEHSRTRWEAIKAVRARTATPEQTLLVHDSDRWMQLAMSQREE